MYIRKKKKKKKEKPSFLLSSRMEVWKLKVYRATLFFLPMASLGKEFYHFERGYEGSLLR